MTGRLPSVIYLECDYGADWPTWVPNHEPPYRGRDRTDYYPLDGIPLPEILRARLLDWQRRWESFPQDDQPVDAEPWQQFLGDGRALAVDLERELGGDVEVRVRLR